MIKKEFIDYLVEKSGIKKNDLIEKDFILQRLAQELIKDEFFKENFIFKGGTCLIKCYLGYYRFSEDIDFTWKKQDLLKNKSGKQIRRIISKKLTELLDRLHKICVKLELDFKPDKKDKKYVQFGGGNIFTTFRLWYKSCISNDDKFVKIQINFVDKIIYKLKKCRLNNLIKGINMKEIGFLFPEYKEAFVFKASVVAYDINEILIEKVRAIITRKGIKIRDFLDVYFITKSFKKDLRDYENVIIEKTLFVLKYEKYLKNMLLKHEQFMPFKLEDRENILLKQIGNDWDKFIKNFYEFLNQLLKKVKREISLKEISGVHKIKTL